MVESVAVTLLPVAFLFVLFGGGALSRRRNIDMDGEAPIGKALFLTSKYAIILLWAAMVMEAWGLHLFPLRSPEVVRKAAWGLWTIGFALLFAGRFGLGNSFRIGSPKEQTGLCTDGLFCLSRNPMYVGVYATLLAAVLYTANPAVLVVGVYVVAVHHRIILAEEACLRRMFGQAYEDYCLRVGRYV